MTRMKSILFVSVLFFSASLFAQDSAWKRPDDSNKVIVHKDPRLDLLVKKQVQINEESSRNSRKTAPGYRLMVISTNDRNEAIAAKTKIYSYFPELKAYLWYQSPYFRLKVGNFEDRKDAEAYQKRLNIYFPNGVFIMKDIVEVKPGKPEDNLVP